MKAREKEMSEQIFSEDDLGKMKSTIKKQKTKRNQRKLVQKIHT